MKTRVMTALGISVAAMGASPAMAAISAVVTADNHYSIYQSVGGVISLVGGNELGAGGAPGTYNWSLPETHFIDTAATAIYIAAWSDDSVAQGLLVDIDLGNGNYLRSGDPLWKVHCTHLDLDDGAGYPTALDVMAQIGIADSGGLWASPYVGGQNIPSTGPWGKVPGVSDDASWMWGNPDGMADPLNGGENWDEWQLYAIPVPQIPAPGAVTAGALTGLAMLRRRRR